MKAVLVSLVLVLAIFVIGCQEEVKVYRIGAVIPLSGSAEAYGRNVEHGMKLALEQINNGGGVKGKKLDIFIEDDRSDEKIAVQKANQLMKGTGVPIIIGGITSNNALALAPECGKEKVVLLSPTATSPKLTGINPYFFRNFPSDTLEGQVMAQYAIRRMKIRSVATLYIDAEYGQGITKVFHDRFQGLGGTVSYEKAYPAGTQDFSGFIKEIKAAAPDGIYLPGYYTEIAAILNEIKKQQVAAKILSVQGMATPMILEIAGEAAEGVVYPQPPFNPESTNPNIKAFVAAFRQKFPTKPDVDAAFAYDALHVVARAIENCVNYPEDLRARLADTNYRGITGEITFTSGGDVDIQPRMFQVKGGQFIPIE